MKITFISIGAVKKQYLKEAAADYLKRIKRYVPVESIIVKECSPGAKAALSRTLKTEAEAIRARFKPGDFKVALTDTGDVFDTKGFSKFIEDCMSGRRAGKERLCFIIGGSYGLDEDIVKEADMRLSLSRMTMPHELAAVVLFEQVYRALTIIKGEKYSH